MSSVVEVAAPAVHLDVRVVGAEQHLGAQLPVGGANQLRREVLRRPAGQVDVDVRLVRGDGDLRVHPRHRGMGHHDRQLREVGGDVVEQHRVGVPQLDAVPARQPDADAGLAGVEQRGHTGLGDRVVDRVEAAVVGLEGLHAGVELEALDAVVATCSCTPCTARSPCHGSTVPNGISTSLLRAAPCDQVLDGVGRVPGSPSARRW